MPTITGGFETGTDGYLSTYVFSGGTYEPINRSTAQKRSGTYSAFIAPDDGWGNIYYPISFAENSSFTFTIYMRNGTQSFSSGSFEVRLVGTDFPIILNGEAANVMQSGPSVKSPVINERDATWYSLTVSGVTTGINNPSIEIKGGEFRSYFIDDWIFTYESLTSTYSRQGGVWKPSDKYVKHNGVWKPSAPTRVRHAGVWKDV